MKTWNKKILNLALAFIVTVFAVSCDTNYAPPEDLTVDQSISIGFFKPQDGASTVTLGDSIILEWEVTDENSKVAYVEIYPDVGTVATSGTKQVTPQKSTVYTLTVFADGEAVRETSIQITVLDAAGQEIVEAPEAEICDDGADNDQDGLVDCDDDECSEEEYCAPEETEFYINTTVDPENPIEGDSVTVSWETNYASVMINGDPYTATGEYVIDEITVGDTTVTINMYDENGSYKDSEDVTITASEYIPDEEPGFSASVYFTISPSLYLIYGEYYEVSWDVTEATDVTFDGQDVYDYGSETNQAKPGSCSGSTTDKHSLTVEDEYANVETRDRNLTIACFASQSAVALSESSSKMIPATTDGSFYFVTSNAVYKSSDYFTSDLETLVSMDDLTADGVLLYSEEVGTIHSFLDASDGNMYIGTNTAVFMKNSEKTTEIIPTYGYLTITAMTELSDGTVLFGTDENVYKLFENGDDDGYGAEKYTAYPNSDSNVNFIQFVKNPQDASELFAVTDKGVFVYDENSEEFTLSGLTSSAAIKNGNCNSEGHCMFWSAADVYEWVPADDEDELGSFDKITKLSTSSSEINFATKQGFRYFLATADGVKSLNDHLEDNDALKKVFTTNLTDDSIKYIVTESTSGNFFSSEKILHALTATGTRHTLTWKAILLFPMIRGDFTISTSVL